MRFGLVRFNEKAFGVGQPGEAGLLGSNWLGPCCSLGERGNEESLGGSGGTTRR